ncbi:hypothetical protein VIGAN_01401500 [Vigna angularis var. angularis]|uniref:Uncharacterized protein n=1 Tax=Vigna angularis var. angularis TaxID=157739 RepID=A0A0S3R5X0_PHAAN|nr:hypothetical protein VIGAN_01401500 [Vigna angularis var. angularis]
MERMMHGLVICEFVGPATLMSSKTETFYLFKWGHFMKSEVDVHFNMKQRELRGKRGRGALRRKERMCILMVLTFIRNWLEMFLYENE